MVHVTDVFHKPLLSHRTSQQTIFSQCSGERQNIFEKLQYHHSFTVLSDKSIYTVSLPWKLSDFLDTSFSWTLSFPQGPYFSSFSLGTVPYIYFTFLSSWVSNSPIQLGWSQDAPAWVCRPSSLQHLRLHPPGSTFWSRSWLLPITHAQLITSCPFNLSVGQSCLHFISPLISNYPHQYPKSHNLGFHQHPLHDTKIKPSQLALNSSPPYNQTISSSQNPMFIIDNKHSLPDYT